MKSPNPEIRHIRPNGEWGEILPDWRGLDYLDDTMDVGSVQFDYPEKGGLRRKLISERGEYALLLDGKEVDNSRFILDAHSGNTASDTPGYVTWTGKTYIVRCDEAIIGPVNDEARLDVLTPEERQQFLEARNQWVRNQINKIRKKHQIEPFDLHADDDDSDDRDLLQGFSGSTDGMLDEGSWDITGQAQFGKKLQEMNLSTVTWRDKIKPEYWRHRFEPGSDMQERLDTAPPPVPPTFRRVTPGAFVKALFDAAQERGSLDGMRIDFNAHHDSAGVPWRETLSRKPDIGSTLLEQLRWLAEAKKAEPRMRQRTLRLFNADFGRPDKASVLFAKGHNIVDGPQEGTSEELITAAFCISDTGIHGWVYDQKLIDRYGVIEGVFEAQGVQTWRELRKQGRQFLRDNGRQKNQNTFGVVIEKGTTPYRDFRAGSWVLVDAGTGRPEPQRIRAITLSWDDNRVPSCGVTLNDRLYEADITNQRLLRAMTGKKYGQATMGRVQPFQASTVSDARPPKKPSAPTVASRNGQVEVGYDWTDEDGYDAVWDQDHAEVHMSAEESYQPNTTTLVNRLYTPGSAVLSNLPYNETRYVRFVAVDRAGDKSTPSDIVPITTVPVTGDDLDPTGPPLPPQLIPGEGWEYLGNVAVENLVSGRMQADVSVATELWVAKYASDDPDETEAAPDSNKISLSADHGLRMQIPTGVSGDGTVEYDTSVWLPTEAYDPEGNRIAAVFRGKVIADDISVMKALELQGKASDGDISKILPEAALELGNTINAPGSPPDAVFGPVASRWPTLPSGYTEIGWGVHNAFVVQGRVHTESGNERVQARFINTTTGLLDHVVDLTLPMSQVQGFTCGGGWIYVLYKFRPIDPFQIGRFGISSGVWDAALTVGGLFNPARATIGYEDGSVWFWRNDSNEPNPKLQQIGPGLGSVISSMNIDVDTNRQGTAAGNGWVCTGSRIWWLDLTATGPKPVVQSRSWWSQVDNLTGFGLMPDGTTFAGTNKTGSRFTYNSAMPEPSDLRTGYTRIDPDTGNETLIGDVINRTWPTRQFATITTGPTVPGAEDVGIYVGDSVATLQKVTGKPVGESSVFLDDYPTSGIAPPTESGFSAASVPGCVQSESLIPGTTRRAVKVCGNGETVLYGLRTPSARRSSTVGQQVNSGGGAAVKVQWNVAEKEDIDLVYDAATDEFIATQAGEYFVSSQVAWQAATGGYRQLGIRVNGAPVSEGMGAQGSGAVSSALVVDTISVFANDRISIWAMQNSGAAVNLRSVANEIRVSIKRLGI